MRRLWVNLFVLVAIVAIALTARVSSPAYGDAPGEPVPADVAVATERAVRVDPPAPRPEGSEWCPAFGHAAVIDRAAQRAWLCTDGVAAAKFPITTAITQPAPGSYSVYAKDRVTTSTFGGHFSYLDNFVAFTRGVNTGARIAFHAVPRNAAGQPFQPLDTVGDPAWKGQSSGCIRVLPSQSVVIWNHLSIGDKVIVIS